MDDLRHPSRRWQRLAPVLVTLMTFSPSRPLRRSEIVIRRDAISIRRVARGDMTVGETATKGAPPAHAIGSYGLYVERPAGVQPNTQSAIFRLMPDGKHAQRVTARFGRLWGSHLEITGGLQVGDRVIVTDMSAAAGFNRVRVK